MGKLVKAFRAFLAEIPDDKLRGFPEINNTTIYTDRVNFRLDMQCLTSDDKSYNLQIQINNQTTITSVPNKMKGDSVACVIYGRTSTATPAQVRAAFQRSYDNGFGKGKKVVVERV